MVQEQTDGGRVEIQKKDERERRNKRTDRERNDEEEANLVIDSPAFYGSPSGTGRYSRDCDYAAGPWLRDAERARLVIASLG